MSRDAILDAIAVRIQRAVLFVVIAVGAWLLLWMSLLQQVGHVTVWHMLAITRMAMPPATNEWLGLMFWLTGVIGLLIAVVLYLLVALWWRGRGDVHRRGTKFINKRED